MKVQVNLSLTEEVRDRLDALAMADRKATGSEMNRSLMVEALVNTAFCATQPHIATHLPQPTKRIEPVYELTGKRKKLIGFDAWYGDDLIDTRDTRAAAQAALDAYVYEELSK